MVIIELKNYDVFVLSYIFFRIVYEIFWIS